MPSKKTVFVLVLVSITMQLKNRRMTSKLSYGGFKCIITYYHLQILHVPQRSSFDRRLSTSM